MARKSQHISITTVFGFMLTICTLLHPAMGQTMPAPSQQPIKKPSQVRPLSLPHLYWHFLDYINHLDTKSLEVDSQGKNGSLMRNYLQGRLGFSDADFAPLRASSLRLTAEMKDLDTNAEVIQKAGASPSNLAQLKTLTIQRKSDIYAEMSYLKQTLPPDKITAFEAFITQYFSPANASPRPPSTTGNQAPAGVQK